MHVRNSGLVRAGSVIVGAVPATLVLLALLPMMYVAVAASPTVRDAVFFGSWSLAAALGVACGWLAIFDVGTQSGSSRWALIVGLVLGIAAAALGIVLAHSVRVPLTFAVCIGGYRLVRLVRGNSKNVPPMDRSRTKPLEPTPKDGAGHR